MVALISLMAAIFIMVYARLKVLPLSMHAASLAAYDDEAQGTQTGDKVTLLEAIQKLNNA